MCLIIHALEGMPDIDLLEAAHVNNSNGFGLMYLNDKGRVITEKIVPKGFRDIQEVLDRHTDLKEFGLHFSLTTHGESSPEMSHPFQVLSKERSGRDLFLMHNGPRLPTPLFEDGKSDTWHFIEYFMKPTLERNPDLVGEDEFIRCLDRMIGTDKMLLLDSEEGYIRVNEGAGVKKPDMWLSNAYSVRRNKGMNYDVHSGKVTPTYGGGAQQHGNFQGQRSGTGTTAGGTPYYYGQGYGGAGDGYADYDTEADRDAELILYGQSKYSQQNRSYGYTKAPGFNTSKDDDERLSVDEIGSDTAVLEGVDPVDTEELIEAFTEDRLYEYILDNFEGVVAWLRESIRMPEAA